MSKYACTAHYVYCCTTYLHTFIVFLDRKLESFWNSFDLSIRVLCGVKRTVNT